jgi:hypothetical protein
VAEGGSIWTAGEVDREKIDVVQTQPEFGDPLIAMNRGLILPIGSTVARSELLKDRISSRAPSHPKDPILLTCQKYIFICLFVFEFVSLNAE